MTLAAINPEWMIFGGTRLWFEKLRQLNTGQRKNGAILIGNRALLENPY